MPEWIDLHAHGVALLARQDAAASRPRALILRRLRPDAEIPAAALDYGFRLEGEVWVRDDPQFTMAAIRNIFPKAKVADMAPSDINYRPSAAVVSLRPGRRDRAAGQAGAPGETRTQRLAWANVPRPRFLREARTAYCNGYLSVEWGEDEYQTIEKSDKALAKTIAHREAVRVAHEAGAELPFSVLVDYTDLTHFGATPSHAPARAGQLLSALGATEELMQGDLGYLVVSNPPYAELTIERFQQSDGERLAFSHYRRPAKGERLLQEEVVFLLRAGRLHLLEMAGTSADGIEHRRFDAHAANAFTKALLARGYDRGTLSWSRESAPGRQRTGRFVPQNDAARFAELVAATQATVLPITEGDYTGMFFAVAADKAGTVRHAMGVSALAAVASLSEACSARLVSEIRQLGVNTFAETLIEDTQGQRYRLTQDGPVVEREGEQARSVEFMTVAEGVEEDVLSEDFERPIAGARLFGREISRILGGVDERPIYYAIDEQAGAVLAYYLNRNHLTPVWECLGNSWTTMPPTDSELLAAYARVSLAPFDSEAFLAKINAAIADSNRDLDAAYRLPEISADTMVVSHPNPTSYVLRFKDPTLPMQLFIEADGDLWRTSDGGTRSMRMALDSACSAAATRLADRRMDYLRRLHRSRDGNLRVGLPPADFEAMANTLRLASSDYAAGRWTDLKLRMDPTLDIHQLLLEMHGKGVFRLTVAGTDLNYEVFSLEIDPIATLLDFEQDGIYSIGQLVEQIQHDLAWREALTERAGDPRLCAWVQRYLDLQVQFFGDQHQARVPSAAARQLVLALADQDVDALLRLLGRDGSHNPSADRLFEEVSGLSLGSANAERETAIYAYVGLDAVAAAAHRQHTHTQSKVRQLAEETRAMIRRAEHTQCELNGRTVTGTELIDHLLAEGYTELIAGNRDAVQNYWLNRPGSQEGRLLREPLVSYARHRLAIIGTAGKVHGPEFPPPALTAAQQMTR